MSETPEQAHGRWQSTRPDGAAPYWQLAAPGQCQHRQALAWVLESGECMMGDHEIVEVVIGTAAQANERARQINTERKSLDAVVATAYPVTWRV